jgi:hypothetical protein
MCKSVERKKTRFGVDLIHLRGFLVHVKIIRKAADQCRLVAVFCDVISRLRTTLATAKKNVGHVMQIIFRATCRPEPRVGHVMHCIGQVPESVTWYSSRRSCGFFGDATERRKEESAMPQGTCVSTIQYLFGRSM